MNISVYKKNDLLTVFVVSLLVIGCSSTYTIRNFSSRDKFYEDFNNFARNKSVNVTLINDSSFSVKRGAAIKNDSLYYKGVNIITGNKNLALSDIKEIGYTGTDYRSASILLKNGEKYRAEQIKINRDSIEFGYTSKVITFNSITSLSKVKKISYKNHWLGVIPGFLGGTLFGSAAGFLGFFSSTSNGGAVSDQQTSINGGPSFSSVPYLVLSGVIIGSAIGWFVGFNYIYQFNP